MLAASLDMYLTVPHRLHVIDREAQETLGKIAGAPLDQHKCLRRLALLSEGMRQIFGDRILQLDLDLAITANIDHLITDHALRIYRCPSIGPHGFAYGPGLMLMDTGVLNDLWESVKAHPRAAMRRARIAGWTGSDQAIIGHYIHPHGDVYTREDGVYSYRDEIRGKAPPGNACMIQYYGRDKGPWRVSSSI